MLGALTVVAPLMVVEAALVELEKYVTKTADGRWTIDNKDVTRDIETLVDGMRRYCVKDEV